MKTPTFATLGAVNHGKSSVVSTLAENDQVRISQMPGETVECQRFSLRELFVFYDTPGFQNAAEALEELRPAAHAAEPLALFRDFIARHRSDAEFEAEVRLFEPLVAGAGIIYVVDGSRPVLEINLAEMELLRLTGQPRLAIINRTGSDDHVAEWKRRLGLHFNAVREFNAHEATFEDRIDLLETLARIEQSWQPKLAEAVRLLRAEWESRLVECAEIIVEEIEACLQHRESATLGAELAIKRASESEQLKTKFMSAVASIEARAHARIIALFGHSLVEAGRSEEQLFANDLFSEETWRMFGLDEQQLATLATFIGAAAGAKAGAVVDASLGGASILAGTVIGGAVGGISGAAGAFLVGKRRPEISVSLPGGGVAGGLRRLLPGKVPLAGGALVVGPYRARNFPWILLDRAIGVFAYVIARTHARRERTTLDAPALRAALESHGLTSARWSDAVRRACESIFAQMRKGSLDPKSHAELRELVRERLAAVSAERIPFSQLAPQ